MKFHSRSILAGVGCLFAAGVVGCSALLGFNDLTSGDSDAAGGSDAPNDTTTGGDGTSGTAPGAPSNVVAAPALVTTLAGSGTATFADGTGAMASFNAPAGVAVDAAGNVYVADTLNHRIRKVTPAGVVSTLAGSGTATFAEGTGATAGFKEPSGVTVDGNVVYVADSLNHRIRMVTAAGVVSTLAGSGAPSYFDGIGTVADFDEPRGVAADGVGFVNVSDTGNHRIRRVEISSKQVVSVVGGSGPPDPGFMDGSGGSTRFDTPKGITADAFGNVFIADSHNHRVRGLVIASRSTTSPAGSGLAKFADGTGSAASFATPSGVALDAAGTVFVADSLNHRIRKMASGGVVTTIAGSGVAAFADGTAATASFNAPAGIAVGTAGAIYVADTNNHRIRKVASLGKGELAVTWKAPSGTVPTTGYTASASVGGTAKGTCMAAAPGTTCTISGLTSGVVHDVSVVAVSGILKSAPSAPTQATPD